MKKRTQAEQVVTYLAQHEKITSFKAAVELGITNLYQVLKELKAAGYQIKTNTVKHTNRNGRTILYNEYSIFESEEQAKVKRAKIELINLISGTELNAKQLTIIAEWLNGSNEKRGISNE